MGEAKAEPPAANTSPKVECCMCGDYGLLNQLFHCTVCLFRTQHRYCSNLYPSADAHGVCNWCLKNDIDRTDLSTSSSSSSCKNILREEAKHESHSLKKKKNNSMAVELKIKKQRSLDKPLGRLTRNFSDIRIKDMKKELLRGKVRKYRLLEDVCR